MKFIELTVHTTTEASEIIADIMWNYTNYGVTICDSADIIALQRDKESVFGRRFSQIVVHIIPIDAFLVPL